MYIPRPTYSNNATPAEIKRYQIALAEYLEKLLMRLEEKIDGEE